MGCLLKQGGGLYPRLRIGAVLLAAGEGRRMGGVAKPLIRLRAVITVKHRPFTVLCAAVPGAQAGLREGQVPAG